jgi:hypothetical protein
MNTLFAFALAACFGAQQPVEISGYSGHAMEPFIARDGETLFFNNRNGAGDQTDMFWASRIDDAHFRYRGPVTGANSAELDGVPSLARDGTFAYISPRIAEGRAATIWTGRWTGGAVEVPVLNHALSPGRWPLFNMDVEISADGARLYYTDNRWAPGIPRSSDLRLAVHANGRWQRLPGADSWFARSNTPSALEYAPATSENELELYFTRLTPRFLRMPVLEIMVATRAHRTAPFGAPERISTIQGFVEAPSVAPDGALYYHAKINDMHSLMRVPRTCERPR